MKKIYVIGRDLCGGCQALKDWLSRRGIEFTYVNASTAKDATWMRINGIFPAYFPCMCVDGELHEYAELIGEKGELLVDSLEEMLG